MECNADMLNDAVELKMQWGSQPVDPGPSEPSAATFPLRVSDPGSGSFRRRDPFNRRPYYASILPSQVDLVFRPKPSSTSPNRSPPSYSCPHRHQYTGTPSSNNSLEIFPLRTKSWRKPETVNCHHSTPSRTQACIFRICSSPYSYPQDHYFHPRLFFHVVLSHPSA